MKTKLKNLSRRYNGVLRKLKQETSQRKSEQKKLKKNKQYFSGLLEQSHDRQEHSRHLARQLLLVQEQERKKISHQLHEEFAQTLAGINLHLATLKVETGVSAKSFNKKIIRTQQLVKKSLSTMLRFARDLRPTLLDDLGLVSALQSYVKGFTARTGIPIHFKATLDVEKLNFIKRTVFYRVAQAALTNVAQHAQARLVKLTVRKEQRAIYMEIKDDGKSFHVEHVLLAKKNKGLGLLGMRERVEMVGGRLTVESIQGKGTTIIAKVPL